MSNSPFQPAQASPRAPRGPFGADGAATAAWCRCGAGPHAELAGRCARGHVLLANGLAVVTGATSAAFWREHDRARRELRDAIIADAGHTSAYAPRALSLAAESIAQSVLVRDSAYLRMVEAGGPLSSSGRVRRAFTVWAAAVDRTERHLRLVGLRRTARTGPGLAEYLASLRDDETKNVEPPTASTDTPDPTEEPVP